MGGTPIPQLWEELDNAIKEAGIALANAEYSTAQAKKQITTARHHMAEVRKIVRAIRDNEREQASITKGR